MLEDLTGQLLGTSKICGHSDEGPWIEGRLEGKAGSACALGGGGLNAVCCLLLCRLVVFVRWRSDRVNSGLPGLDRRCVLITWKASKMEGKHNNVGWNSACDQDLAVLTRLKKATQGPLASGVQLTPATTVGNQGSSKPMEDTLGIHLHLLFLPYLGRGTSSYSSLLYCTSSSSFSS